MAIINPWPDETQNRHCARRRHLVTADLHSLNDRELQDIGIWRDAIPEMADELLSREGCLPHNDA